MKLNNLDEATILQLYTEVKVLEALLHPHIIAIKESYRTESNKLVMILEYATGGDLKKKIENQKNQNFEEEVIIKWILQLCLALKFSHDNKVLHRDLKTSNVFIMKDGSLKLGDFGMAKNL